MRLSKPLIASVLAVALTGCAHAPLPVAAAGTPALATASVKLDGPARAKKFATAIKTQFDGTVDVQNAVVTLTGKDGAPVKYDFTQTPKTGDVVVSTEGISTTVAYTKLMETTAAGQSRFGPAMIVPIAIHVALGGAKALALYWLTHQHDFNREDAIRACVSGMLASLLDFVPYGQYLEFLVPIAVDIIMQIKVGDLKEIAQVALKEVDKLVEVIKHILSHDPAPKPAPKTL